MLDYIIELDKSLILEIQRWHTPFWDNYMHIFSGQKVWLPTALAIIFVIIKSYKRHWWVILLAVAVLMTLSDQLSSGLIKPLVERLRPTWEPTLDGLLTLVHNNRAGGFSFVSSHATNSFAFATFSVFLFKNRLYSWVMLSWASVTAFSRVYLAVHYPTDIICGTLLGLGVGAFVYWALIKISPKTLDYCVSQRDINLIMVVLAVTLTAMAIWHNSLVVLG